MQQSMPSEQAVLIQNLLFASQDSSVLSTTSEDNMGSAMAFLLVLNLVKFV